jgi:mono/diheme cytochrome c family protein
LRKLLATLIVLGVIGAAAAYVLSAPVTLSQTALSAAKLTPNAKRGEYIFTAGGCASCHAAPKAKPPADKSKTSLPGGHALKTPFGTFYVPNISTDKTDGIGGWTTLQFANAMLRGVSPDGRHYYPSFPYTSYQRMAMQDIVDLKAFMDVLPAVKSNVPDHDLGLAFRVRRGLGLWKYLFMDYQPFKPDPKWNALVTRGAYLATGPGHCGECHTPRNPIGGMIKSRWFAGGPAPEGDDKIPNITPHKDGIGDWSLDEIVEFLEFGDLPDGDVVGSTMADVQENTGQLTDRDRKAIALYLKSLKSVARQ